jgi:hypothetical protein
MPQCELAMAITYLILAVAAVDCVIRSHIIRYKVVLSAKQRESKNISEHSFYSPRTDKRQIEEEVFNELKKIFPEKDGWENRTYTIARCGMFDKWKAKIYDR